MRRFTLACLVVAAFVAAAAPVLAHTGAQQPAAVEVVAPILDETLSAAPAGPSVPWTAMALLASIGLGVLSRRRRVVALTLVLVVGLLAFETGIHSTHHLGKSGDASHCVVASMSTQLSGDVVAVIIDAAPAPAPLAPAVLAVSLAGDARIVAPDAGRAPPLSA